MARFQPALLGGLFIGVLSGIPGVDLGNCCCCLWVVLGGMLTTHLQQQRSLQPLETSEGAVGGLVAGLVGALVSFVLGLILMGLMAPFQSEISNWMLSNLQNLPNFPPESVTQIEAMMQQSPAITFFGALVKLAITVPVYAVFAMLGGLLGLAFFRKKPEPFTPPPPPLQTGLQ